MLISHPLAACSFIGLNVRLFCFLLNVNRLIGTTDDEYLYSLGLSTNNTAQ